MSYEIVWLACLVVIGYFGTKIYEIWSSKKRYRNDKAEYVSDLYKLQQKWASKGCLDYAVLIGKIIESINLPAETPQAETEYGKALQRYKSQNVEDEQ